MIVNLTKHGGLLLECSLGLLMASIILISCWNTTHSYYAHLQYISELYHKLVMSENTIHSLSEPSVHPQIQFFTHESLSMGSIKISDQHSLIFFTPTQ